MKFFKYLYMGVPQTYPSEPTVCHKYIDFEKSRLDSKYITLHL